MSSATHDRPAAPVDRRWLVLVVVAIAQLMVVLDSTVVNIALPSAQRSLGFPNGDRQWVVTAYALAFGSLLLVGGRLGDMYSRKWVFITSLAGFAVSSAIGGAAVSFEMLVAARALQGAFGAILAPSALGTLVSTFTDPRERGRAFGVFGSVAAGGGRRGPDPRRAAHPVPVLALDALRQSGVRRDRHSRRPGVHAQQRARPGRGWTGPGRYWPAPGCFSSSSASPTPRPSAGRPG